MKNESGIKPMEYMVLVAPKKVEEKTAGGLLIPDSTRTKEQFAQTEGTLIDVSPMAFTFDGDWPEGEALPQPGDTVLFFKYQAEEVRGRDGEPYWLMKDRAIAGVMINDRA